MTRHRNLLTLPAPLLAAVVLSNHQYALFLVHEPRGHRCSPCTRQVQGLYGQRAAV